MSNQATGTLLSALILAFGLIAGLYLDDEKEAEQELTIYCEMVQLRRDTGDPTIGWPDYRNIYDSECLGD